MAVGLPQYVMQIMFANHPKVLYPKGMVLSVWAKRCHKASGECNEAERKWTVSIMCRKTLDVDKTVGKESLAGRTVTDSCLLVAGQPAYRRQEHYTGFYLEQEIIW